MQIRKPSYYDKFQCLAAQCPDSCCKDWQVAVDPDTAQCYQNLSGDLGDRLRCVLIGRDDGSALMAIENGRCPMWRSDGLCRIQAELGHDALCETCRDFPRLTHDYGDFTELGLELSCPEAARLILSSPPTADLSQELPNASQPDYDPLDMAVLLRTRSQALALLECSDLPVPQALALLLLYGYYAQAFLDGDEDRTFSIDSGLETAKSLAEPGSCQPIREFFLSLEILTPTWQERLQASASPGPWTEEYRLLARYFVQRYWLQAISDFDLISRVKLGIVLCILIRDLGGDLLQTAQLCSKEIENNADNVDTLLDATYGDSAFTDCKLFGLLLEE